MVRRAAARYRAEVPKAFDLVATSELAAVAVIVCRAPEPSRVQHALMQHGHGCGSHPAFVVIDQKRSRPRRPSAQQPPSSAAVKVAETPDATVPSLPASAGDTTAISTQKVASSPTQ